MAHASLYRGQDAHAPRGSALKPTEYIMLQQAQCLLQHFIFQQIATLVHL